jgi:transposase-like protein
MAKQKQKAKRYTARFKFQVVMEVITESRTIGQIARGYGVHPITLGQWKKEFLERGAEVFGGAEMVREYEQRIRELERLVGQKEVEIALLKNFLGEN